MSATAIAPSTAPAPDVASDGSPPVLPDPVTSLASSGDVGAMVAALLLESGKASRDTAKLLREAASAAEDNAHARKIDEMGQSADWKLMGGVAGGLGELAQGGMAYGGGMAGKKPVVDGAIGGRGAGDVAGAGLNYIASGRDTEVAKAEREVSQAKRNVDSAGDIDKDSKDLMRRAMGHYAEYVRARDDASKAALFRA